MVAHVAAGGLPVAAYPGSDRADPLVAAVAAVAVAAVALDLFGDPMAYRPATGVEVGLGRTKTGEGVDALASGV